MRPIELDTLIQGVRRREPLRVAQAITRVESLSPDARPLLAELYGDGGQGHIIGVTGAPGTGKSTLVTLLAQTYRRQGRTVAIVAIDPTSPFTGGAILGDRVRMRALRGDPGVFIRSMATRGSLGGLAQTTGDVVTVLDAAGFERIIVETVGVGQAEVAVAGATHTTLVVDAPGLGDEVQAIKAGILEIADILVVNKADRPGVDRTVRALEMMLELEQPHPQQSGHHGQIFDAPAPESPPSSSGEPSSTEYFPPAGEPADEQPAPDWQVQVLKTIAEAPSGIDELAARIEAHRAWLHASGEFTRREHTRAAFLLESILRAELGERLRRRLGAQSVADSIDAVRRRTQDPYTAAEQLLSAL